MHWYCTVQPLEVMGRQEIQQQSPVEINLSEMSPFISDISQSQLQPQVGEMTLIVVICDNIQSVHYHHDAFNKV